MARISTNPGEDLRALAHHDDTDILGRAWVLTERLDNAILGMFNRVLDVVPDETDRGYLADGIEKLGLIHEQLSALFEDDRTI